VEVLDPRRVGPGRRRRSQNLEPNRAERGSRSASETHLQLVRLKSDPVSLDTVGTTMTAEPRRPGHEGQGAKADHDSWQ
jgi:hypothetical protein